MTYAVIAEQRHDYPIRVLCRVLEVAESGDYAWCNRQPSQREQANRQLVAQIGEVFTAGRQVYGSPRVHAALHKKGVVCSRKRVARLMQANGLSAGRKKHKTRTTGSRHTNSVAPNRLARDLTATAANQKWVGDITGVWTQEGWLSVAALVDIYSRQVVGWAMDGQRDERLVEDALWMALARRQPDIGLLHHTDRGSHYTANGYRAILAQHNIEMSMSRKGDCYDNALMESFFGTLKRECVDRTMFATRAIAKTTIFEYIEVFYNRQRLHSALAYTTPVDFEQSSPDCSPSP